MVLESGDISFNESLKKVEFSETEVEDMLRELYNDISKFIDLYMNKQS